MAGIRPVDPRATVSERPAGAEWVDEEPEREDQLKMEVERPALGGGACLAHQPYEGPCPCG
jgi:hypothetical protein